MQIKIKNKTLIDSKDKENINYFLDYNIQNKSLSFVYDSSKNTKNNQTIRLSLPKEFKLSKIRKFINKNKDKFKIFEELEFKHDIEEQKYELEYKLNNFLLN